MIEKGEKTPFSNLCSLFVYMNSNKHVCFVGEKEKEQSNNTVTVHESILFIAKDLQRSYSQLSRSGHHRELEKLSVSRAVHLRELFP